MQGKFIVLEGTDGSDKGTQLELLKDRLERERQSVATFDFPQYGLPSAYFCDQYLNVAYGTLDLISPIKVHCFMHQTGLNRLSIFRAALEKVQTVISNRYISSNLGHQGVKFEDEEARAEYLNGMKTQNLGYWEYRTQT